MTTIQFVEIVPYLPLYSKILFKIRIYFDGPLQTENGKVPDSITDPNLQVN